ncbi:ATP-binding protein [Streptomyces sp. LMG1-1-1.1]|uniref:ATP-binding protein n=1 Tax=Streptomyces sp. LMG1-1-1.1 TaxID=3135245 RepID=UPI0034655014
MRKTDDAHITHAFARGDLSPSRARRLTVDFLHGLTRHGRPVPPCAVDAARLVTSELVTNALKHAPGPLLLELRLERGLAAITVWDSQPALPVVGDTDPTRVGQHGLEAVTSVARHFEVQRESVGKRVTARIALDGEPTPERAPAHDGRATGVRR